MQRKEQVEKEDNFNLGFVEFELPVHIQVKFNKQLDTQGKCLGRRYGFINPWGCDFRNLKNYQPDATR